VKVSVAGAQKDLDERVGAAGTAGGKSQVAGLDGKVAVGVVGGMGQVVDGDS